MKNTITILLLSIMVLGCGDGGTPAPKVLTFDCSGFEKKDKNLNINVLLDLSDRIDPNRNPNTAMSFSQRDIGYIMSISNYFQCHVANKKTRKINDKIKIFFEPESNIPELNSISNSLNLKFTKDNTTLDKINNIGKIYQENIQKIYNIATNQGHYDGSNIWGFFKNKVNDYIENDYENILIILTDGYIYDRTNRGLKSGNKYANFTSNRIRNFTLNRSHWKSRFERKDIGILSANSNLDNLKVMVIGLNPSKRSHNPYELEILELLWANWFKEMGIKNYAIKTADLPSNLDATIKKFISN